MTNLSKIHMPFSLKAVCCVALCVALAAPAPVSAFALGNGADDVSTLVSADASIVDAADEGASLIPELDLDPRFWSAETVAAFGDAAPEGAGRASLSGVDGMELLVEAVDEDDDDYSVVAPSLKVPSKSAVMAVTISEAMMVWTESEGRYDTVKGDSGRAFGRFQFDYRYCLRDFLRFAYALDPDTFASLKPLATDDPANGYVEDYGLWPALRDSVAEAWLECYEANPTLFSRAQDYYEYQVYYEPTRADMAKMGIPIDNRNDAVKGIVWSMCNCFGASGYHHFVGGTVYRSENGKLVAVKMPGAGLTADMSDLEFVTTLVTYLQNNIMQWYSNGAIYITRYGNELAKALPYIPDLVAGEWYMDYVDYVTKHGLITGYGDGLLKGRFAPEDRLTRGMAVTVIYRASGEKGTSGGGAFSDVYAGDWYAEAVNWAKSKGIVTGFGNSGLFKPNELVTREDLTCMLARFAATRNQKVDSVSINNLNTFPDRMNISDYAQQSVAWCVSRGIITGKVDGTVAYLAAQDKCRRSELAKMITILHRDII